MSNVPENYPVTDVPQVSLDGRKPINVSIGKAFTVSATGSGWVFFNTAQKSPVIGIGQRTWEAPSASPTISTAEIWEAPSASPTITRTIGWT